MTLSEFFLCDEILMDYEDQFNAQDASTLEETIYSIFKVEVQEIWDQIKALNRKTLSDVGDITENIQML